MSKNIVLFLLGLLVLGTELQAEPCQSVDEQSCWSVVNHSNQGLALRCVSPSFTLIAIQGLSRGASDSTQFDLGYGDGLGFSEPDVVINCSATLATGQKAELSFVTRGWGARVAIEATSSQLNVVQREYWQPGTHSAAASFSRP